MSAGETTPVTQLVRALAARPGLAGLTPATRLIDRCRGLRTSEVIEQLITLLDAEQARPRH